VQWRRVRGHGDPTGREAHLPAQPRQTVVELRGPAWDRGRLARSGEAVTDESAL